MAAKPLTTEAIALTEKKMDMTLDEIIKMSKTSTAKPKKQQRLPNKARKSLNNASVDKSVKVQRYMESRSSLRQAALAQRRSNFQGNQFPLAAEHARKAVVAPNRNRNFNRTRAMNVNTPRVSAPPAQRRAGNGGLAAKQPQQPVKLVPKQRPQTMDSLFANMREQRMKGLSQQSNGGRRNAGGQQRQYFGKGRFGN